MRKFIAASEFHGMRPNEADEIAIRSAGSVFGESSGRSISYIFSDESVARDLHTIATAGWQLEHFLENPVFLFAHDTSQPPIGKVTSIEKRARQLVGTVEYADADTYPFADTIFRLTKGGFLNATSVSWLPLEWKASSDRKRPGGMDFTRQELLEISSVPVPALPTALVTARAAGIDTAPIFAWAERMLDSANQVAIPRAELEALRREAKMPASPKPKPEAAFDVRAYGAGARKRGLYELSSLCDLMGYADYVCRRVEQEAEDEKDGSPVPARMRAWVDEGNKIIAAMAAEETAENIQGTQDPADVAGEVDRGIQRALGALGLGRAGKAISAANHEKLCRAKKHAKAAVDSLTEVIGDDDDADPEDDPDNSDDGDNADNERALDERRARALALKAQEV